MRRHLPKHLLLILSLVLGQWLAVAHAHEHAAQHAIDQVCQICLHAPGIDAGTLGGKPAALPPAPRSEAPQYAPLQSTAQSHTHHTRIRGPPAVIR